MDIFGFFKPKTVFEQTSQFNKITVVSFLGTHILKSDGITQSAFHTSDFARHGYWKKAADIITTVTKSPKEIVFLGLGGGTSIHYLSKKLPTATLTAVEIDAIVVEAARKFFEIDKIPNLKIHTEDAFKFIKTASQNKYDVIFADMFKGGFFVTIPNKQDFFMDIQKILNPGGLLIFNYTFKKSDSNGPEEFINELKKVFTSVKKEVLKGAVDTDNYLIYCQK